MKKILVIAGTRPEIIKTAPLVLESRKNKYSKKIKVIYCFTGQHKKMAINALKVFGIKPDINLNLMAEGQTLDHVAAIIFQKLPKIFKIISPHIVVVQGDTTTAAAAAISAFHNKIPVAHIEAGLRSFNLNAPFPEEFNRRTISSFAKYNFCPTKNSKKNLINEKINPSTLFVTGNTVVDALEIISSKNNLDNVSKVNHKIKKPFVLITAHRRESFGEGFKNICNALKKSAVKFPQIQFVYPVHLNPNVQKPVYKILGKIPNIFLIEPVNYLELLTLLKNSLFVITDSGGIQEEAASFSKHCIVMREVTERNEAIDAGFSHLVGTNKEKIYDAIKYQIGNPKNFKCKNPFGDGKASARILKILSK